MNKLPKRDIPVELRPYFIKMMKRVREDEPTVDEDILWEVTARIVHAETLADWFLFKQEMGIK